MCVSMCLFKLLFFRKSLNSIDTEAIRAISETYFSSSSSNFQIEVEFSTSENFAYDMRFVKEVDSIA